MSKAYSFAGHSYFMFSVVVWFGDMNFRIRKYTREEVINKVKGKLISVVRLRVQCS